MNNNQKSISNKHKSISYAKWGYIFIAPFFVVYMVFQFVPLVSTFYYSFFEQYMDGLTQIGPNFVGFDNYVKIFTPDSMGTVDVLKYLSNTVIMWVMGAVPQLVFSLLLAVIYTSARLRIKGQRFFKTVMYMPNLIMAAAFAMLFFTLFSNIGPINQIITSSGGETFDFFANKWSARAIIAFINFLMWFGNTTILLMAGIMGIDQSLFEAASIDGASSWQVFTKITMPLLTPIMVYVAITSLIGGLQMFDVPQIIGGSSGTPGRNTMTLIMWLNNYLGTAHNYGMAGAISVIVFIITGVLSFIVYKTMVTDDSKPKKKKGAH
ncbi:MAG TPA: ABC transporter permease [Ruminococcaceae bacterium]|nr:ABC transporter permease [Oscillospiraceae bacterium]